MSPESLIIPPSLPGNSDESVVPVFQAMDVVGVPPMPISSVGNSEGNVAPLPQTMDSLEALVPAVGDMAGNEAPSSETVCATGDADDGRCTAVHDVVEQYYQIQSLWWVYLKGILCLWHKQWIQ